MKKVLYYSACVATALMVAGSLWYIMYASNLIEERPDFIQKKMAGFKFNYDGKGLGFTFSHGSVKGEADARILGWGKGWGLDEYKTMAKFFWFSWSGPDGRIWFDISSDIKLTEADIQLLTWSKKWHNEVFEGISHDTRIKTSGYWRDFCIKEVEPDGITAKLVCDKKEVLDCPLFILKKDISSISKMEVEEYLFSR